jgi:hypothetical protein
MIQGTIINGNTNNQPYDYTDYNNNMEQSVDNSAEDLTNQFKAMFNAFADNIPNDSHEAKTAKNMFKQFSNYIGSNDFENSVNEKAEKYKVPPKQIAKNFFLKVLGIIGDILGIVVNTVCNIVDTAVTLLATLLHGAVSVVGKVGNGLVSVISLNQTNAVNA